MKIFLLEKAIRALFLAEQLKVHSLGFLFKGGTSLLIQLQTPQRFSIDVDIVSTSNHGQVAVANWEIPTADYNRFNRLRKTNPVAFFYVFKAYHLLQELKA